MILVTGATGLVGGHLLWHLLQENERVIAICRNTSKTETLRSVFKFYTSQPDRYMERIDWVIADVLNRDSISKVVGGATCVYHCAAVVSLGDNADTLLKTNVEGTRNIVQAALAAGVEKFCFVSSIAACGKAAEGQLIDENSVWMDSSQRSLYSKSKYLSEQEVWNSIALGLNAVIVNPGVILGLSPNNSGSAQLFSQVRKGLYFYINGGTGYVDVQDVVKAMIALMNSNISGERFVLVGENCSNRDVLSWMADGFGKKHPFIPIGYRSLAIVGGVLEILGKLFHFHPLIDRGTARSATHREYYSSKKIQKAIDFQFTPIEKCIRKVCDGIVK